MSRTQKAIHPIVGSGNASRRVRGGAGRCDPPRASADDARDAQITLSTIGYGDITPVNPIARSLAALEGFTGQLFPAITLARLVAMEVYHRQQRGE